MKRESLLNLRTSHDIITSLEAARLRRTAPTMLERMRCQIARGMKEIAPHPNEAAVAVELDWERRRFAMRLQAVERSAAKILGFRRKLAATREKHRRIMDLRLKMQKHYWDSTRPVGLKKRRGFSAELATAGVAAGEPVGEGRLRRFRYGGRP